MTHRKLPHLELIRQPEAIRALAHPLRANILSRLASAQTVKQLADDMGEAPARVFYHVKTLERLGLVRLVETRLKGPIQEKYFQAVAQHFGIDPAALEEPEGPTAIRDATAATLRQMYRDARLAFGQALEDRASGKGPQERAAAAIVHRSVTLTRDQFDALLQRLSEAVDEFDDDEGTGGSAARREYNLWIVAYPAK